ncbi:MAG: hypothetical protein QOJ02_3799 [Acidobacteriota bacterium]|jgi:hypothetical protein|nr:hypothetical protein [Acidobacteriota bacterium]
MLKIENHSRQSIAKLSLVSMLALSLLLTFACGKKTDNSVAENSGNQAGGLKKSLNVANEAAAIRTLQTIYRAQTQYMLSHAEEYGTFDQLKTDNYLDQRFAGAAPVVEGYAFTMKLTPKSGSGEAAAFSINADPKQQDDGTSTAGARHLYMDSSSNVVHASATQSATANDPPLQ